MLTVTAPGQQAHALPNGQRCPCTPEGGINVGEFNTVAGQAFNRLPQDLRRRYGDIQYARAAEIQKRGALHFHIIMRVPRLAVLLGDFDKRNPQCALRQLVEHHGFGHEIELEPATESAAWYCAKYVSKSCDDHQTLPWLDRQTGELSNGNGRYRPWSASRRWGATMASIRATQATWARAAVATDGAEPPKAATRPPPALLNPKRTVTHKQSLRNLSIAERKEVPLACRYAQASERPTSTPPELRQSNA